MALKRRNKILATFSMSSMTDVIFLLLIFFMVTSTVVFPNAIKVLLPQSKQQTSAAPLARVTIDEALHYYVAFGNEREKEVTFDDIEPWLVERADETPEMYVALYAAETIPYSEVVRVLDIATHQKFKMVLATRPIK